MIIRGLAYQRMIQSQIPMRVRPMIGWNIRFRRLLALGFLWMMFAPAPKKQVTITRKRRGL